MWSLASSKVEQVLSLIDSGHNASTITWLWSKHCPAVPKPHGGCPTKLSDTDIHHACHLISSGKADNSTQVTKLLQNTGRERCVQMKPRLITWAQMGGNGHGKGWMSLFLTGWCKEPKSLVEDQSWCGDV